MNTVALGIQNIIVGLNPEFLVVAGTVCRAWSLVATAVQAEMRRGIHGLVADRTQIIPSSLKEKPSLVGAITLGVAECFGLPTYH